LFFGGESLRGRRALGGGTGSWRKGGVHGGGRGKKRIGEVGEV